MTPLERVLLPRLVDNYVEFDVIKAKVVSASFTMPAKECENGRSPLVSKPQRTGTAWIPKKHEAAQSVETPASFFHYPHAVHWEVVMSFF